MITTLYIITAILIGAKYAADVFNEGRSWGLTLLLYLIWGAVWAPIITFVWAWRAMGTNTIHNYMNPNLYDIIDAEYEEVKDGFKKEKS